MHHRLDIIDKRIPLQLQPFNDFIEVSPIDHTHNIDGFLLHPVEDSIIA